MKQSEIVSMTDKELADKVTEEVARLNKLKFAHSISPIENPMRITLSRKLVAKLKTELTARKNKNAVK